MKGIVAVNFIYDEVTQAGYVNIVEGAVSDHRQVLEPGVVADIDKQGNTIGVEFSHLPEGNAATEEHVLKYVQEKLF